MFERIDNKLKWVARIIFWISVVGGGIWLIFSIRSYVTLSYLLIRPSLTILMSPIIMIISGIVTSYLFYGFGELIGHVRNIDYRLKGTIASDEEEDNTDIN